MKERLQKILAHASVGSRRDCEVLIESGRVAVNGQVVTQLGTKADPQVDLITVDGRSIHLPTEHVYILMNKPTGYLTTVYDPQGRPTVMDLLPRELPRVFPIGRLDRDTEGLLILTNDGEFAHWLLHPRFVIEKEYLAYVEGRPSEEALDALRMGVEIDGRRTAPAQVEAISVTRGRGGPRTRLRIIIHEGRKRQVRRMCESVGHPVVRLIRIRVGAVHLGDLPVGAHRQLTQTEVRSLVKLAEGAQMKDKKRQERRGDGTGFHYRD